MEELRNLVRMARSALNLPKGPAVVQTNPGDDCSAGAFQEFLDEILSGPEPELESIGAAEALRELRDEAAS